MLELKQYTAGALAEEISAFNRTVLELKLGGINLDKPRQRAFNRTVLELKPCGVT